MKWFYLFILSISFFWGCTQNLDGVKKYQEDVRYFFKTLRELHVDPYVGISKDSFYFLEKEILEQCKQMKNVSDLNIALMSCNQYFDGHTYCDIHPDLYSLMPSVKLPLEIRNDSIFWLPTGEHVVSLDTFTSTYYLTEVKKIVSYDLSLKKKNTKYANSSFFYILNDFKLPRYIELYHRRMHKIYRQILDKRTNFASKPVKRSVDYDFKYFLEDSIAVFQYNTSDINNFKQFQDTVQYFFDMIEKLSIKYLFIDVRKNGGGSDIVHQPIYRQVQFMANGVKRKSEWTSKGRRLVLKKLLGTFYGKGQQFQVWRDIIQTYWQAKRITENDSLTWTGHQGYNKEIFILHGERTFSAAYNFCWVMRLANPNCILVGMPVGQINPIFGNRLDLQLPNTKIPFTVATQKSLIKYNLSEESGFLMPDICYSFQCEDTVLLSELKQIIKLKYQSCTN